MRFFERTKKPYLSRHHSKNTEKGFTLIELLIAMALALVIIGALSNAFVSQRKTYAVQEQVSEMIQNARAAMDMVTREIKMAGYNPTGTLQKTDSTASDFVGIPYNSVSSTIDVYADIDGDGFTTGSKDHITYSKATGEEIIRRNTNTGGGAQPLAENIQSFTIEYKKGDGTAANTSADILSIIITVEAKSGQEDPNYTDPTYGDGYRRYKLTSYVTPPNLDL